MAAGSDYSFKKKERAPTEKKGEIHISGHLI